jgi:pimeloyl-ACP methyl ester carboxylesterase
MSGDEQLSNNFEEPTDQGGSGDNRVSTGRGKRVALISAIAGLALVGLIGVLAFSPLLDGDLASHPSASTGNAAALQAQLSAADGPEINPECRSIVLNSGRKEARSVVLLHGFTSCPAQWVTIAKAYAAAGYNVVVPRLPGHGYSDRLTTAPSDVTPQQLANTTDQAIDLAAQMGDRVTVVGLSAGGSLAAWAAAHRNDVAEADVIAPLMLPRVLPEFAVAPVARIAGHIPDFYLWWDGDKKEALATPPYAYPRYSLRALGAFLALGRNAQHDVTRTTQLERLLIVTNENDGAVSNTPLIGYENAMRPVTKQVDVYEFPSADQFKHDLVTLNGENQAHIKAIYAKLATLLTLPNLNA